MAVIEYVAIRILDVAPFSHWAVPQLRNWTGRDTANGFGTIRSLDAMQCDDWPLPDWEWTWRQLELAIAAYGRWERRDADIGRVTMAVIEYVAIRILGVAPFSHWAVPNATVRVGFQPTKVCWRHLMFQVVSTLFSSSPFFFLLSPFSFRYNKGGRDVGCGPIVHLVFAQIPARLKRRSRSWPTVIFVHVKTLTVPRRV